MSNGENGDVVETAGATDSILSADGSTLYVALQSGSIDVFNVATGQKTATWSVPATPGALSLTTDGASLLVAGANSGSIYRIDLTSGSLSATYTEAGGQIYDVQAIANGKAAVTGSSPAILDLATGIFSPLADASSYGNGYSHANSDDNYTLLGATSYSTGDLFVLDNQTGAVIAAGNSYQSPNSGFNFGSQAISENAGEILQFIYSESINVYDLNVHFLRSVLTGEALDGLAFNSSGSHVYAYSEEGTVIEYDASTFNVIARYVAPPTELDSDVTNYGNAVQITSDEHYAILTDYQNGGVKILDLTEAEHQLVAPSSGGTVVGTTADEEIVGGEGVDILTGGGGNDTFLEKYAGNYTDHITDFSTGDRIDVPDNPLSQLSFERTGSTLDIHYGPYAVVPIDVGAFTGRLVLATDAEGTGTDLIGANHYSELNDFNGDSHSDILWRNDNGVFATWDVTGNAVGNTLVPNTYGNDTVAPDWHIAETFDFNGDGLSDILWRNVNSGTFTVWEGASAGGFTQNAYTDSTVGTNWSIAAIGDWNGDGRDDIIWHNGASGAVTIWSSTGSGFTENAFTGWAPTDWQIAGTGDFNGDGKADLLWRKQTTGQFVDWLSTGTDFQHDAYSDTSVGLNWHVQGIADFDGDGKDDLLWRNTAAGQFTIWTSNGTGFTPNTYANDTVGPDWQIAQVGDFNDDGKADILWRNTATGTFTTWQSNGHGFDENVVVQSGVGTDWHVQGHEYLYG